MYEAILYEKQRKGVLITLNRPEVLNALSGKLQQELRTALDEAERDPEVRAIVITGAGRAFSSGADIGGGGGGERPRPEVWPYGLPEGMSIAERLDTMRRGIREGVNRELDRWEMGKPVISAVNGWCMGAGSWLALSCHMVIAADDAVFAQPEIRMIDSSSFFWILQAGYKNGLRYSLTGDHIDAQEALRIGLVNKVVPRDRLLDEAFSIVERIALVSPETVKINLQVATLGMEMMGLHNALSLEAELAAFARSSRRYDFLENMLEAQKQGGMRAFLQARDGPFQPEPFGPRSRPRGA